MKQLIVILLNLCVVYLTNAQGHAIINNARSPFMPLKTVDFNDCRWTTGFWADKQAQCVDIMVPNLGRLMANPEIIHAYENFKVAAGLKEGEFRGWSFHDGDFYKYIEAMAYAYALTKDEKINQQMDEIIGVIAKAQRKDGYLHTMIQIGHGIGGYHHESEKKFTKKNGAFQRGGDHEFYNFGHLMTAACVHYRLTGKTSFLDIARKASDLLYETFKTPSQELAVVDWNPPHYMGLTEMYRTTGDKKYLELAQVFIDMRGTGKDSEKLSVSLDQSLKRVPIRQMTEGSGHAGFANYLYAGVADVFGESGDDSLRTALEKIWMNVSSQKMYVTGATGAHHFALSVNREQVSESYGKNYLLPSIGAYNETCANIGNAMWNWRMFLITGEAKHADIMERVFYNSALSGIALDGKHFFYTNPLRHLHGHPQNTKDKGIRSPWLSVFCCPPNIIRTIASMNSYAYTTSEKGIWVNVYGANTLDTKLADGSTVKLTQQTEYPWKGLVKISVDLPQTKSFSMMLRIPGWATGASLKVNGKVVQEKLSPGTYFDLNRKWSTGDVVELDMPMQPQLLEANPFVEEDRNQVAVQCGPLVYCLESVDLPRGVSLSEVVIPHDIVLKPKFEKEVFSGINVLVAEGEALLEKDWTNQLYRPLTTRKPEKIPIRLIPYYAWGNRGPTDMSVWLPVRY